MTAVITFPRKRQLVSGRSHAERMGRGVHTSPFEPNGACVYYAIDHAGNRLVEMITAGSLDDTDAVQQLWDLLDTLDPVGPEVVA